LARSPNTLRRRSLPNDDERHRSTARVCDAPVLAAYRRVRFPRSRLGRRLASPLDPP
jgi:hypothetical protein